MTSNWIHRNTWAWVSLFRFQANPETRIIRLFRGWDQAVRLYLSRCVLIKIITWWWWYQCLTAKVPIRIQKTPPFSEISQSCPWHAKSDQVLLFQVVLQLHYGYGTFGRNQLNCLYPFPLTKCINDTWAWLIFLSVETDRDSPNCQSVAWLFWLDPISQLDRSQQTPICIFQRNLKHLTKRKPSLSIPYTLARGKLLSLRIYAFEERHSQKDLSK